MRFMLAAFLFLLVPITGIADDVVTEKKQGGWPRVIEPKKPPVNPSPEPPTPPAPQPPVVNRSYFPLFKNRDVVEVKCEGDSIFNHTIRGDSENLLPEQFTKDPLNVPKGNGLLGRVLRNSIPEQDEQCAAQAMEYLQEDVQMVWRGSGSRRYSVLPDRVKISDNAPCRYYKIGYARGENTDYKSGRACRHTDGWWVVVNR